MYLANRFVVRPRHREEDQGEVEIEGVWSGYLFVWEPSEMMLNSSKLLQSYSLRVPSQGETGELAAQEGALQL